MAETKTKTASGDTDLKGDVDALKDDLARLREDLKTFAGDAVEQGKLSAEAAKDAAKEKYENTLDSVESFVQEKPLTAVGIAFAAGVVTSIYFRNR